MFRVAVSRFLPLLSKSVPTRVVGTPFVASFSAARLCVPRLSYSVGKRTASSVNNVEETIAVKSGNDAFASRIGTPGQSAVSSNKGNTKEKVEEILKSIDITSPELSTTEAKKLEELDKLLNESPELKNLSMDEIIGMLNISEDDKKQLASQVDDILKSGDLNMKDKDIREKFPAMDPTIEAMMSNLEKEFDKVPGVREEFQNWINATQQQLGANLEMMEKLSPEEIDKLALPPPRVKEILDRIIPDTDKFNSLKLDEGMDMSMDFGVKGKDDEPDDDDGEPIEVEEIKIR